MSGHLGPNNKVNEFIDESTEEFYDDDSTKVEHPLSVGAGGCHSSATPSMDFQLSTTTFEQEPSILKKNIAEAILDGFPDFDPEDMEIERIEGGAYNHIVGITLRKVPPKFHWYTFKGMRNIMKPCFGSRKEPEIKPKHLILRVPRFGTQDIYHQVTTLNYLKHRLAYPVPGVVVIDSTPHNSLGNAYMLQERLPGQPLGELWVTLNYPQRLSSMRAISKLLLELRKVRNKCPGIISIRNTTYDLKHDLVRTEPIPIPSSSRTAVTANLPGPQTTKAFLLDLCSRQSAYASAANLRTGEDLWPRITKMIHTLHKLDLIPDSDPFHLYHSDMLPRNLLMEVTSDTEVRITGILDWDSALFAPSFMSTRAPSFAWSEGEDEKDALVEPQDEVLRKLKKVFEGVVGETFLKSAYSVELMLARRLWGVLIKGFACGDDAWMAEDVLNEFERMYPPE
ncbi:hypothetical protein yc1106_04170 [Curvularia clavata]|uniref:Aminoglycoside phosphotransferase domain-containing protein n=1 Tax=Curvularia clavata TaxID=95742 RepID=A0A9Q9DSY3_CURCL|nr:hypothetical protein yc1106_04170 [Curvularia clavata]